MNLISVRFLTLTLITAISIPCSSYAGLSPQEIREFKETEDNVKKYREEIRDPLSAENFNKQKWARLNLSSYLIELGNAYFLGHGVNKSDTDALKSWQEAAKLGNKSALFNLGHCYYAGIGVAKDEAEAYGYWVLCAYDLNKYEEYDIQRPTYEFLEKSRKEGVKVENAELVKMCRQDFRWIFNTAADARTNAYMLEKVISVDAQQEGLKRGKEIQASLEVISEKFRSTKKDALLFQKAEFEKLRERAIAGDIKAQYELARSYLIGYKDLKFAPDEIEADKWYKSAADGGNVEAQIWLSEIFLRDKKTDEAVAWLRKASAQGNRQAHELMARCYLSGTGVPKSIIDAYAYLNISNFVGEDKPLGLADLELKMSPEEKRMGLQRTKELHVEIDGRIKHAPNTQILIGLALQRGNKPDQYGLGSFFQVGPVDQVEAVRWFRKAAEQGDPNGEYYVGRAYDSGKGVPEDKAEGVRWYRKAAEKGLAIAQYMLGNAYETGEGVPKDEIEAYAYFNLAGATDKDARKRIASMEETMQPNIRLLGQQRTRELRKEIEGKMETMEDLRKAVQMEKQLKGI